MAKDLDKIKAFIERVKAWHINNLMQKDLWKIRVIACSRTLTTMLNWQGLSEAKGKIQVSKELDDLLKKLCGPWDASHHAKRLTDHIGGGTNLSFKREDLNHYSAQD